MIGYYYEFRDINNNPVSAQFGPYQTKLEVEKRCLQAYKRNDFQRLTQTMQ